MGKNKWSASVSTFVFHIWYDMKVFERFGKKQKTFWQPFETQSISWTVWKALPLKSSILYSMTSQVFNNFDVIFLIWVYPWYIPKSGFFHIKNWCSFVGCLQSKWNLFWIAQKLDYLIYQVCYSFKLYGRHLNLLFVSHIESFCTIAFINLHAHFHFVKPKDVGYALDLFWPKAAVFISYVSMGLIERV